MAEKGDRMEGNLSSKDLGKVINYEPAWSLRHKWKYIGLQLDITEDTLNEIEQTKHGITNDCFTEVVSLWLRNSTTATWNELEKALTAPSVIGGNLVPNQQSEDKAEATGYSATDGCASNSNPAPSISAEFPVEVDVTRVGVGKQKSPIHLLEGSKLKLVAKKGVKEVEWQQSGKERIEEYIECNYTNESNKGIPVFIQKGYEIPRILEVNSKLQYGWQGDFYFFVLHDKERTPFQHRFVSTTTKEFLKKASKAIAGIWGAHLKTVKDV